MSASPESLPVTPDAGEKDKKYDRQLRLWGDHGQAALERSSVCVIGCSATASELLKSLVLAGLGSFTIVDNETVTVDHVDANFFLECDSVGECRGSVVCRLLLELNGDVRGAHVALSPHQLIASQDSSGAQARQPTAAPPGGRQAMCLDGYSAVVAADLSDSCLTALSELLWKCSVPLVVCQCHGPFGSIRVQLQDHAVIESHPDTSLPDLRLETGGWPALRQFMDSQQLNTMTRTQHMHTPYLVLLYKCLQRWNSTGRTSKSAGVEEQDSGAPKLSPPKTYAEKKQFKQMLDEFRWRNEDGSVEQLQENIDEAQKMVNTCFGAGRVPDSVQQLFNCHQCETLTDKSSDFWLMVRALRDYVHSEEGGGLLPVRGDLPDMFSDSHRYIQLQTLYTEQAERCCQRLQQHIQPLLRMLGRPPLADDRLRHFCRNTHALRHFGGTRLCDELRQRPAISASHIVCHLQNPDGNMAVYVLLRAIARLVDKNGAVVGARDSHLDHDISALKKCVCALLCEWGCCGSSTGLVSDDYIQEMCRYGDTQLHCTAAFIGGCAAHEVIKLLTSQYAPINNTFIYNGITCMCETFRM